MAGFNYSSRVLGMSSEGAGGSPSDIDRNSGSSDKHAYFTLGHCSSMSTSCSEEVNYMFYSLLIKIKHVQLKFVDAVSF